MSEAEGIFFLLREYLDKEVHYNPHKTVFTVMQ